MSCEAIIVRSAPVRNSISSEGKSMRTSAKSLLTILHVGIAGTLGIAGAQAQNLTIRGSDTMSLKSGEHQEVQEIYYVTNCVSLLKSTPQVEIVQGPPGVTAEIKEAMVLPRE